MRKHYQYLADSNARKFARQVDAAILQHGNAPRSPASQDFLKRAIRKIRKAAFSYLEVGILKIQVNRRKPPYLEIVEFRFPIKKLTEQRIAKIVTEYDGEDFSLACMEYFPNNHEPMILGLVYLVLLCSRFLDAAKRDNTDAQVSSLFEICHSVISLKAKILENYAFSLASRSKGGWKNLQALNDEIHKAVQQHGAVIALVQKERELHPDWSAHKISIELEKRTGRTARNIRKIMSDWPV